MIGLATAFGAALVICAPAAAQPAPDPCAALAADTSDALPGSPWPDGLARPAPGTEASEDAVDLEAACREEIRKSQEEARQRKRDGDARRFDAIPGPGSPGNDRSGFGETMALTTASYEAQRLRTAHRINQQGIRTAQRGDWIGALQMFEMAAQYAPDDPVIQRNLAEARIRAARQAEELGRRQRQQR